MNSINQTLFGKPHARLQIQTVLYNTAVDDVERAVTALARAVELAGSEGLLSNAVMWLGDSGPTPALNDEALTRLRKAARDMIAIHYDFFNANLGSARGHNRLADRAEEDTDFIWIQNPDVVVAPRTLQYVLEPFGRPGVGQVEARQIPIEHPKEYDRTTGETAWTTTACVMTPFALFKALGGFDADTFFLYCDDVDLAFRIREAGFRLLYQPAAPCFHDKRLSDDGKWQPTNAERYYSAEAALMMAHKWSYPDRVEQTLSYFNSCDDENLLKAARAFEARSAEGTLPIPRDPEHEVARFNGHFYAVHRYDL